LRAKAYAPGATARARGIVRFVSEPNFILAGERAALGTLEREHLPALSRWFNDPDVRRGLAHRGILNVDAEERWYEEMTEAARAPRPAAVGFAVHAAADAALVGACSLDDIDHNFGRADFGIFIGERRGTGIGGDATRLVLDWAFHVLGLHNVMLETYVFNEHARRAYERAGFREIGRRRDAVRALGRRWDSILMDATADGFESPVLGA
jgi:RimJ/RimL family protein N-acetyltransferase